MVKNANHVSAEDLDQYTMSMLPQRRIAALESHLLTCPECQERLQAEIDFVTAMRGAAAQVREGAGKENGGEARVFKAGQGG
jgi:anti-sigma factor RsiW